MDNNCVEVDFDNDIDCFDCIVDYFVDYYSVEFVAIVLHVDDNRVQTDLMLSRSFVRDLILMLTIVQGYLSQINC